MSLLPSLWGPSSDKDPFRSLQQEMNRLFEQFGRCHIITAAGVAFGLLDQGIAGGLLQVGPQLRRRDTARQQYEQQQTTQGIPFFWLHSG